MRNKDNRFDLYFYLLNIATCCCYFFQIIGSLNTSIVSTGGDGMKNYFTYLYFVKYDRGTHFTGMNYPFGEHMTFTDNMPAVSWTLAKLRLWFPEIQHYSLGIMHFVMMAAFFVSAIFIYKILKLFNVKGWWAIFSAIFIAYFSPQFIRLGGHFGLAMSCCIPMIVYCIMQYERKRSFKYVLFIFPVIVLFTFCHVYFLAIGLILILAYTVAFCLTKKGLRLTERIKFCVPLVITALAAIVCFKLFLYFTDTVMDRPKFPLGFLGAATTGEDILTSAFSLIGSSVFKVLFGRVSDGSEGYTYLGLVTIIVLLFLVYRIFRSFIIKKKKKVSIPTHPVRSYRVWLLTAFFCLLFAMGVPFLWGLDFLIEYFSTFRQFRSIGRFSWIFYYIMMIYVAILLYRAYHFYYIKKHKKLLANFLLVVIVLINVTELYGYVQTMNDRYKNAGENYKEYYNVGGETWNQYLKSIGHPANTFQSAIGLPYFHIGSDKVGIQWVGENYTFQYGSQLSFQTGLPLADVMMSRTSWSQTYEQLNLVDGPLTPKPILNRYNKLPVLLFVNKFETLTPNETWLVNQTKQIGDWAGFYLYELNVDTVLKHREIYADSIKNLVLSDSRTEGLLPGQYGFTYNNHFDTFSKKNAFLTRGAFNTKTKEFKEELITFPVTHPTNDTLFTFSIWLKCIDNSEFMPYIIIEEYDKKNDKIFTWDFLSGQSTYHINDWHKAERVIPVKANTSYIKLYAFGGTKNLVAVDELLIYPKNATYFNKYSDTVYLINNRPVKIKD